MDILPTSVHFFGDVPYSDDVRLVHGRMFVDSSMELPNRPHFCDTLSGSRVIRQRLLWALRCKPFPKSRLTSFRKRSTLKSR